jgi:hypothetical protein
VRWKDAAFAILLRRIVRGNRTHFPSFFFKQIFSFLNCTFFLELYFLSWTVLSLLSCTFFIELYFLYWTVLSLLAR